MMTKWDGVLRSTTVTMIREWPKYDAVMSEALVKRNAITGLEAEEKVDKGTLFHYFFSGLKDFITRSHYHHTLTHTPDRGADAATTGGANAAAAKGANAATTERDSPEVAKCSRV